MEAAVFYSLIPQKIYQFKAENSETKPNPLCLGNISKKFTANNVRKKNNIDTSNIINIHKYLMKKTWYKIMLGIIKKMFIVLWTSMINASNHAKCVFLSNQKWKIHPTLFNLHSNEYGQELHYYPFVVTLFGWVGSCNTINNLQSMCSK